MSQIRRQGIPRQSSEWYVLQTDVSAQDNTYSQLSVGWISGQTPHSSSIGGRRRLQIKKKNMGNYKNSPVYTLSTVSLEIKAHSHLQVAICEKFLL